MEEKETKKLAEELILKKLEEKGITMPPETEHTDRLSQIMTVYGCSITSDFSSGCDAFFYTETTADDYEVWIATTNDRNINVNEDVYYYESTWFEKLADYLRDGYEVYIDEYSQDGYEYDSVIEALYEEWYMEQYEEVENELIDEGYKWPE